MKQLRDNWAILCGLVIVAVMAGRTLQRVDRIEQDVSAIRTRLGLADSSYSDLWPMMSPFSEGLDSCPVQPITAEVTALNYGPKWSVWPSLGETPNDCELSPSFAASAYRR